MQLKTLLASFVIGSAAVAAAPSPAKSPNVMWPYRADKASTPFMKRQSSSSGNCNGSPALCDRLYSNVTFAGSHDSAFVGQGTTNLGANQNLPISKQLDAGVRMLQVQAHRSENASATGAGIDLVHTSANIFQAGAIEGWLSAIKSWSDANPREVITLLLVNSDNLPASQFGQAFDSTGLSGKAYKPSQASLTLYQWPTLSSLISANTPIVAFLASGADTSSVPYLLPEFSNMWENRFGQTTLPFSCSVDRIADGASADQLMYVHNHFLDQPLFGSTTITTPNVNAINSTNSEDTVLENVYSCASQHGGRAPNFILANYVTLGDMGVIKAAAQLNGVEVSQSQIAAGSSASSSSSSSGSSGGSSGAWSVAGAASTRTVMSVAALAALVGILV